MLRWSLSCLFALMTGLNAALAAPDYAYLSGYAFLVNQGSSTISVVDLDAMKLVEQIDAGTTPTMAVILDGAKRLAVADGVQRSVSVYDIRARALHRVELQFAPTRLLASADGRRLAAVDLAAGRVAFIDPLSLAIAAVLDLPPIEDAMFDGAWERLHVIHKGGLGYQTFDARNGRLLSGPAASPARYTALSRSSSGRQIFARRAGSPDIDVVDLVGGSVAAQRRLPGGRVYATGGGRFLLSIEEANNQLVVDNAEPPSRVSSLSWGAGEIYGAWLDTVAFVSRGDRPELLAYDLENRRVERTLTLPGVPGRGAVTADGARLVLPLPEAHGVAIIDARTRTIEKVVPMNGQPFLALIAGAYGLCH